MGDLHLLHWGVMRSKRLWNFVWAVKPAAVSALRALIWPRWKLSFYQPTRNGLDIRCAIWQWLICLNMLPSSAVFRGLLPYSICAITLHRLRSYKNGLWEFLQKEVCQSGKPTHFGASPVRLHRINLHLQNSVQRMRMVIEGWYYLQIPLMPILKMKISKQLYKCWKRLGIECISLKRDEISRLQRQTLAPRNSAVVALISRQVWLIRPKPA